MTNISYGCLGVFNALHWVEHHQVDWQQVKETKENQELGRRLPTLGRSPPTLAMWRIRLLFCYMS